MTQEEGIILERHEGRLLLLEREMKELRMIPRSAALSPLTMLPTSTPIPSATSTSTPIVAITLSYIPRKHRKRGSLYKIATAE